MINPTTFWLVVLGLGLGTYFIRFSFLGALGGRQLPRWLIRALRYTAVAVLPALVAPAVMWPTATGGQADPARLSAALVTVAVGAVSKNTIAAILCGAATLFLLPLLTQG